MDYELAKQLKDAGFPQKEEYGVISIFNDQGVEVTERAKVPTLYNLIEACGGNFQKLVNIAPNGWGAERMRLDDVNEDEWFEGSTPTEAVARLWLALHKR